MLLLKERDLEKNLKVFVILQPIIRLRKCYTP